MRSSIVEFIFSIDRRLEYNAVFIYCFTRYPKSRVQALQGTVSIPLHSPTGKEAGYLELFVKREV
jgi:hypothetical protein